MTDLERRRLVLELALLTVDRTRQEQQALLDSALRLDNDANKLTLTNRRPRHEPAYGYVTAVIATWDPSEPCKPVRLKPKESKSWQQRIDRWEGRDVA